METAELDGKREVAISACGVATRGRRHLALQAETVGLGEGKRTAAGASASGEGGRRGEGRALVVRQPRWIPIKESAERVAESVCRSMGCCGVKLDSYGERYWTWLCACMRMCLRVQERSPPPLLMEQQA